MLFGIHDSRDALETSLSEEMIRHMPFPFPDGRFPPQLGAVIQRTVLEGHEPAREVIHDKANNWMVGGGITDPNLPGASVASHMQHVIDRNSSVAQLASLPPGHMASREGPSAPWTIAPHEHPSD